MRVVLVTHRLEEGLVQPRVMLGYSLLDQSNSNLSWLESAWSVHWSSGSVQSAKIQGGWRSLNGGIAQYLCVYKGSS
jgi:hypothetical protein